MATKLVDAIEVHLPVSMWVAQTDMVRLHDTRPLYRNVCPSYPSWFPSQSTIKLGKTHGPLQNTDIPKCLVGMLLFVSHCSFRASSGPFAMNRIGNGNSKWSIHKHTSLPPPPPSLPRSLSLSLSLSLCLSSTHRYT